MDMMAGQFSPPAGSPTGNASLCGPSCPSTSTCRGNIPPDRHMAATAVPRGANGIRSQDEELSAPAPYRRLLGDRLESQNNPVMRCGWEIFRLGRLSRR
jgi:hypothetical protein